MKSNAMPRAVLLLEHLLDVCVRCKASDLHMAGGHPPYLRVEGEIRPLEDEPSLDSAILTALAEHLSDRSDRDTLTAIGAIDGALSTAGGARFRYNVYRRGGTFSIAFRRLEDRIRRLSELGLPDSLYRLSDLTDGLVLLAGPTGCGKSTTLATLIDRVNQTRACHVITIEDPIEYIHTSKRALVNQRQIGIDAPRFNDALVASLRQDPDVILVGEIRDLETIRTAITAAETGHLVFSTVHASDCVGAVDRLVSVFPADEQVGVRRQLSMSLKAIIAQHLLVANGSNYPGDSRESKKSEKEKLRRLVLASEVMIVNSGIANLIAHGKSAQIYSAMETGAADGMYTIEESLGQLWQRGEITERSAVALSRNPQVMLSRARRLVGTRPPMVMGER